MDQRLRLQADFKDNASPKIRQLGKELRDIRRTPGMEQAEKWFGALSERASSFVKDGGGVAATMGAIGVGGLTAAASIAGLVKQLKDLGDHTFAMKRLGQETGLTLSQVQKWEYVGQVFRVPVEQMDAALKTLGDQMVDFRRRRGELFGALSQLDPRFAERLQLEDTQHQLQDIFTWLSKIPDAAARNRWAKEFFGTDDLNSLLTNGFPALQAALADANKNVTPVTADFQAKADLLNKAIVEFNQAWTNFEVEVGPAVFAGLKEAADDFRQAFDDIKGVYEWWERNKDKSVKDFVDDNAKALWDEYKRRAQANGGTPSGPHGRGEDGNALRRNDEAGGLFHRSAYVTGLSGGDSLSDGVKEGVLAAFREWAAQSDAAKGAEAGVAGLQKASLTTFGAAGPGGQRGAGLADLSGGGASGDHADFIRSMAAKYGIDPRVAVAVANSEGLHRFVGDNGTSFGDFQLHVGGGLGDLFRRQTGLDPADPSNWKAADEWALKYASRNGWGPWHGAARIGVTGMMGIGGGTSGGDSSGGGSPGSPGRAVDIAMGLLGAGSGDAARALGSKMTPGEWCADFVNGAFKAAGMQGVNSSMARAFSAWGRAVGLRDVQKGDVILERHGDHVGHVGLATGRVNRNGDIEMVSGNYGHAVRRNWEHPGDIAGLRRAIPSLVDEANKAAAGAAGANGSIEAHVHIHDGHVRGATARSTGVVKPPSVHLRRGPTMTMPNIEA